MVQTLDETVERIRDGRVPFRASSFFRHCQRAGVGSVPLVGPGFIFSRPDHGFVTGYQLQALRHERLVPDWCNRFYRELGPLITGIMLAAPHRRRFTAEWERWQSREVEAIEAMGLAHSGSGRTAVARLFLLDACLSTIANLVAIFASCLISRALFQHCLCLFSRPVPTLFSFVTSAPASWKVFSLVSSSVDRLLSRPSVKGGAAGVRYRHHSASHPPSATVIGFRYHV